MSLETQVYVSVIVTILYICVFVLRIVKEDKMWPLSSLNKLFGSYVIHSFAMLISCYLDYTRSSVAGQYAANIIYTVTGYVALFLYGRYYIETCEAPAKRLNT